MKTPKNRREEFLQRHPKCAFCGGLVDATTIEHCPPRAFFQYRHWPERFEFPSCQTCNEGTSDDDLLVATMARSDPFFDEGNKDGKQMGLLSAVNAQYPGLFERMKQTANQARRQNREYGIKPKVGQLHQEVGGVIITDEFHKAICVVMGKLAKAIFYLETGLIFPNEGCLLLSWFTNAELIKNGSYEAFDLLKNMDGLTPSLTRSGKGLNDQFEYKITIPPGREVFVLQGSFGKAFGFIIFGSPESGRLEESITRLKEQTNHNGPFAILQSSSLATTISGHEQSRESLPEYKVYFQIRII